MWGQCAELVSQSKFLIKSFVYGEVVRYQQLKVKKKWTVMSHETDILTLITWFYSPEDANFHVTLSEERFLLQFTW